MSLIKLDIVFLLSQIQLLWRHPDSCGPSHGIVHCPRYPHRNCRSHGMVHCHRCLHWNCRSHGMVHCHRCLHWNWRPVFFCFDCCSCRFVNHWYLHCTRYHDDVRGSDLVTMPLPYSTFFYQHRVRSGTLLLLYGTRYPLMIVAIVSYRYSVSNFKCSVLSSPLLSSIDVAW